MNSLFARIMTVVLCVILVLTVALSVLSYFNLRSQRITARLDYLASEAADIAYLAADLDGISSSFSYFQNSRRYLNRKAQKVNDEFGAYIAVVDRWGNVMDNLQTAYSEDPDFVASLSGEEITAALKRVLAGESIRLQSTVGTEPAFTVGVPFIRYESVAGAVIIQTKAQQIESGMEDLLWQVVAMALLASVIGAAAVSLVVRSMMKPLGELTGAARAMGRGDFSIRVDETKGDRELRALSGTFNAMSDQLRQVEDSRREFVANVSHELSSPITSIRGFAEGMAEGVIPPEEHPKYLRLVAEESRRLSRLVEDLLQLSRLEREDATLKKSEFDINEMLRRALIRRMNDLEEKQIDVDCDFREDPCPVYADSERIEQVVINLLDNAMKFTGEKGRIVLTTEAEGNRTAVTVWDDGVPFPEEDREKVFDRFFTSDRAHTSGKGTGLGLSICQRIMEMHGSPIQLLRPETGTAFRILLDRPEGKAPGTGLPFTDLDSWIEERAGITIPEIFEKYGEEGFRRMETGALAFLTRERPGIIAPGGGAAMAPENRKIMRAWGSILLLDRPLEPILADLRTENRPLLQENPEEQLQELYDKRMPVYREAADVRIPNPGDYQTALNLLVRVLRERYHA